MNREYQKFGKANLERAAMLLKGGNDLLPEACRCLWEVYENFLDYMEIRDETNNTIRNRNKLFEEYLRSRVLHKQFTDGLFGVAEVGMLADLEPRIFHEESYQRRGNKNTDEHKAFSSDVDRVRNGRQPKQPIERLLNLLYIVRCNLDHGQKVLPDDWPEIHERNLNIFRLVVPIQQALSNLLFETVWADGVFVYGTLKLNGGPSAHVRDLVNRTDQGYFLTGKLYDLGMFPGLVLGSGDKVPGLVLHSTDLRALLRRLDQIEGSQFARRLSWASTETPGVPPALVWVYEFVGEASGANRCKGGRWPVDEG